MFSDLIQTLRVEAQKTEKTNAVLLAEFEKIDKQRMARRVSGAAAKDAILSGSVCLVGVAGLGFVASAFTGGAAGSLPALVAGGATVMSAAGFILQSVMPVDTDKGIGAVNSLERSLALGAATSPHDKPQAGLNGLVAGAKRLVSQRIDALVHDAMVEKGGFVTAGSFAGRIMEVTGDKVVQRTHPSGATVIHSPDRLSSPVTLGDVVNVRYGVGGIGVVSGKAMSVERG